MKRSVFLLFIILQAIVMKAQDEDVAHNAEYFYDKDLYYYYPPKVSLQGKTDKKSETTWSENASFSIKDGLFEGDFLFGGDSLKNYIKGYLYFVLSPSPSLKNMDECYMYSLGRINIKANKKFHYVFPIAACLERIKGLYDDGRFETTKENRELKVNQTYYQYAVLRIYGKEKWQTLVLTEAEQRSVINYEIEQKPIPPVTPPVTKTYDIEVTKVDALFGNYYPSSSVSTSFTYKSNGNTDISNASYTMYLTDRNSYKRNSSQPTMSISSGNTQSIKAGSSNRIYVTGNIPFNSSLTSYFQSTSKTQFYIFIDILPGGGVIDSNESNNYKGIPITIIR